MPLKRHTEVMDGLDSLAERRVRAVGEIYQRGLVRPMLAALRSAKSERGALAALGPALIRRMDDGALARDVGDALDQAAGIGMVSATPRETDGRAR